MNSCGFHVQCVRADKNNKPVRFWNVIFIYYIIICYYYVHVISRICETLTYRERVIAPFTVRAL